MALIVLNPDHVREAVQFGTDNSKAGSRFAAQQAQRRGEYPAVILRTDVKAIAFGYPSLRTVEGAVGPTESALLPVLEVYTINRPSFC